MRTTGRDLETGQTLRRMADGEKASEHELPLSRSEVLYEKK